MTELLTFEFDSARKQPAVKVQIPPSRTPFAELNLRFEAWGSEYQNSHTLFALFDGDERVWYTRPLEGSVLFVDDILSSLGYTLRVNHGPNQWSERGVTLTEREMKHLGEVRFHLKQEVESQLCQTVIS